MPSSLTGATRVHFIVGHPIAQVKSPAGVTAAFARLGADAMMIPIDAPPDAIDGFFETADRLSNVDGIVATVPYKFEAFRRCRSVSERSRVLGVVNVMRRLPGGGWHGDMTDGVGFRTAAEAAGCVHAGKSALLIGAGGAGSAIALALIEAGVASLEILDLDRTRANGLVARIGDSSARVTVIDTLPDHHVDIVANASPVGMRDDDPSPFPLDRLRAGMHVGDVTTPPSGLARLVTGARAAGCTAHTGVDMFNAQVDVIAGFLLSARD
jgi:shikimate dehydrogenase